MVASEPELDEVVGRTIPNCPDIDRGAIVGGDKGVGLEVTPVADTVGARAWRGCLRLDVVDVVDFVVVFDDNVVDGNVAFGTPDPVLLS